MFSTKVKVGIVTIFSIIIVSYVLFVNQKIMQDIESMQTTVGKTSLEQSQPQIAKDKRIRTPRSFSDFSVEKEESGVKAKSSSRTVNDKKEKAERIYEMPSDRRFLMQ